MAADRERHDNSKWWQPLFDPTHSFSYRGENADLWSLTHWVNLIPTGCHGNLPVWVDFDAILSDFFQKGLLCQVHYIVLIYVARWPHNFREIAVRNYEKSKNRWKRLCAPLRINSWEIWRKFHRSSLGGVCKCAPIKIFLAHVPTWLWQQVSMFV